MDSDTTKDEYSYLSSYGNNSYLPASVAQPSEAVDDHNNFITFLAVAQRHLVDFLPITWQSSLGSVGRGASAEVEQSHVVKELGLAFKKFSASPSSNENILKGMTREISILQHPPIRKCVNIISLEGICWNFDNTDVGMSPVLVYRLGRNLVDHLRDTKVSFEERLQYVRDIGRGMMVLHASGAVHGDLKPENIIVNMDYRTTPPSPTSQIADFSFSYIALADEERVRLPRSEPWSAPEWHARAHTLHQAQCMDVYSYGLLCYWILFNDHIATKAHFAEEVGRIVSLKARGSLADTIFEQIDDLDQSHSTISVLKLFFLGCLSNNHKERYQLISRKIALLADTELADEVTVAVANSKHLNFKVTDCLDQLLQVEYWIRQRIFQILKMSLESRCQDCVKNAALQTALCHRLALGTVKDVHAASEILTENGLSEADLDREIISLQECQFPDRPGLAKWYIEPDLVAQYQARGEMEEAIKLHEEEVIALKECLDANHPLVAMTTITLAHLLDGAGQTLKALELCTEQRKLVKLRVNEDHYDNFASLSQMAFYQWRAGYIEDAIVTGEKLVACLRNSETVLETDRLSMSSFSNLATAYVDAMQYEQAVPMLLRLIELHNDVLGCDHPESLTTRQNLAVCYSRHIPPRFKEALNLQTAVLKTWGRVFGPNHRNTIGAAIMYASILFQEGSGDKAAFDLYEWAMEASKEQLSESNPDTWLATSNYAYMLIRFESVDQAITLLRRSLQKSEELLPPDHPNILDIMLNLSTAYIRHGLYDDAELLLNKVLQSEACISETKPTLKLWVWNGLGKVYQRRGVKARAKEAWEYILTLGKQHWGIHHTVVRYTMRHLCVLYIEEGRHDEGIQMLKKVVAWCKQYMGEAAWESIGHKAQLGDSYNAIGKFAEAQKILSEVFLLAKETLGATEVMTMDVQGNLAYALHKANQWEMAKDLAEDVMQKRISILGRLHEDTLLSMRNLFCMYLDLKLWSEASSLAQGISTTLTELGNDLSDTTWQYLLADLYARSKRLEEGQKYFLERLAKLKEQHEPEAACDTARYCLAYILSDDTNRLCDAAKLMDQVLTYRISLFGEYSSPTCQAVGLLGAILRDQGDLTGAVAMFQRELRVSKSLKDGLNVHDILDASENLITVYKKLGYTEEIVDLEKAIEELDLG